MIKEQENEVIEKDYFHDLQESRKRLEQARTKLWL